MRITRRSASLSAGFRSMASRISWKSLMGLVTGCSLRPILFYRLPAPAGMVSRLAWVPHIRVFPRFRGEGASALFVGAGLFRGVGFLPERHSRSIL